MTTLQEVHEALTQPFPPELVEIRPGATNRDKTRALALAYVDARQYMCRLDETVGPHQWTVSYRPLTGAANRGVATGTLAVVCNLTICGISREDVGEAALDDPNAATSATMQAFKRACAAFGLGRYLYSLPNVWGDYDPDRKQIKNPGGIVHDMYRLGALRSSASSPPEQDASPVTTNPDPDQRTVRSRKKGTPAADVSILSASDRDAIKAGIAEILKMNGGKDALAALADTFQIHELIADPAKLDTTPVPVMLGPKLVQEMRALWRDLYANRYVARAAVAVFTADADEDIPY